MTLDGQSKISEARPDSYRYYISIQRAQIQSSKIIYLNNISQCLWCGQRGRGRRPWRWRPPGRRWRRRPHAYCTGRAFMSPRFTSLGRHSFGTLHHDRGGEDDMRTSVIIDLDEIKRPRQTNSNPTKNCHQLEALQPPFASRLWNRHHAQRCEHALTSHTCSYA